MLGFDAWISLAVTATVFIGLNMSRGAPSDLLFLGAMVAVTLSGVITPEDALAGFANPAVLTIGGLLAVSAGLRVTGVLDAVGQRLLGSAMTEKQAITRLAIALVSASAFILNTALVAMAVPVVVDWCRRRNISPSRILIPVSYLAILGGVCTLIGTSTTLIVNGILKVEHAEALAELQTATENAGVSSPQAEVAVRQRERFVDGVAPMRLFEIGCVGLPCALLGTLTLVFVGRRFLPNRRQLIERLGDDRREYLVEMLVRPDCRLIGQTVEAAGLRQLPGLFLIEIDREGGIVTPVTPEDEIRANDRLIFTGVVSTIVDLEKIPGLVPAADISYELHATDDHQRHLSEVVLSRTSPLIGTTVREANFRQRYNAVVVAVHRNGVRLTNKVGRIVLEPGDTLLLQTRTEFVTKYRNSREFYLVSDVDGFQPRRHHRAVIAGVLAILLVIWLIATSWLPGEGFWAGWGSPAVAAIAIAGLMVISGCLRTADARSAVELQVLLTIVGALSLGRALTHSGAAKGIAELVVSAIGENHPYLLLIGIYLLTLVFTEMITNNAVAAMLLPLAIAVAQAGGLNPRPFVMAIALASSLSFVTPIGYQTNLMVMGPGGYRPRDYLRVGIPMAVIVATTALILIPIVWSFEL